MSKRKALGRGMCSLTDELAARGFRHERTPASVTTGAHAIYKGARLVGHFTAREAWEFLKPTALDHTIARNKGKRG